MPEIPRPCQTETGIWHVLGHRILTIMSSSWVWWKDGLKVSKQKCLAFGSGLSLVLLIFHLQGYLIQLLIKGKIETADEKNDFFFSFQRDLNLWKVHKCGPIIQVNLQPFPWPPQGIYEPREAGSPLAK